MEPIIQQNNTEIRINFNNWLNEMKEKINNLDFDHFSPIDINEIRQNMQIFCKTFFDTLDTVQNIQKLTESRIAQIQMNFIDTKNILREKTKQEMNEKMREILKQELKKELKEKIKPELQREIKQELKEEMNEDAIKELKRELREELEEEKSSEEESSEEAEIKAVVYSKKNPRGKSISNKRKSKK